ncbi:MAG TPA: hypothetical protein VFF31_04545, partial [Blastocatellia bacterium]|nr:hypothetical protein [Blastocatellia bacterium]
ASIDEAELKRVDDDSDRSVDASVEYADSLPFPQPETVTDRLFAPSPHDPRPEDRANIFQSIENPAIPSLTAARDKSSDGHF